MVRKKVNFRIILFYLLSIMVILNSATMYRYLERPLIDPRVIKVVTMSLCLLYVIMQKKISPNIIKLMAICGVYLIIYILVSRHAVIEYLQDFVIPCVIFLLFACELVRNDHLSDFLQIFSNVMVIIGMISIFFWFFGSNLRVLPGRKETAYFWANRTRTTYSYFNLYFENPVQALQSRLLAKDYIRNTAIFCEAPGYVSFLAYALGIELYYRGIEKNRTKIGVLLFTLITTLSTKAYLILIIVAGVWLVFYVHVKSRAALAAKVCFVAVLTVIGLGLSLVIITDKLSVSSGTVRIDDLLAGIRAWMQNPIWGSGFQNKEVIFGYTEIARSNQGLSMGLTTFMAQGGLYLLFYYVGSMMVVLKNQHLRNYRKELVFFIVLIFVDFLISNVGFSYLVILTVSLGYATVFLSGKNLSALSHRNHLGRSHLVRLRREEIVS